MNPAMAAELMGMDATETGSFNKLEKEILIKINKFKTLYPSLCPAPMHAPAAATATVATKLGSFKLERRRLPKFQGTLREYPTFKKDWLTQVAPNCDDTIQLYKLRELVPAKDKVHVEKLKKNGRVLELHGRRVREQERAGPGLSRLSEELQAPQGQ